MIRQTPGAAVLLGNVPIRYHQPAEGSRRRDGSIYLVDTTARPMDLWRLDDPTNSWFDGQGRVTFSSGITEPGTASPVLETPPAWSDWRVGQRK